MRLKIVPKANILSLYLLRAHIGPFLFSLLTIIFLFLLQFIMKFIDQLAGKGLSALVIVELMALSLAWMLILAVPMSVLVAALMAFGELSSRNEITAMRAGGMSVYRMMAPIFLAASVLAVLLVSFNNDILPEANHRLKSLMTDIRRKKPTLSLVPGLFSQDISGYSILVRKTFEKSNDLEGVTIYDHTTPGTNVVITAEHGQISFSRDYRKLIMDLQTGEIHELDMQQPAAYRRIRFTSHRIAMNVEGFDFERTAEGTFTRGDRELSAGAMEERIDSLKIIRAESHQRLEAIVDNEIEHQLTGMPAPPLPGGLRALPGGGRIDAIMARVRTLDAAVSNEFNTISFLDRQIDQYKVEIHKKYSIPAACLVFVLIGVPLGIMARRGGFGIAATLSLGFFVLYWAFLVGGEKLADRDIISPFNGMWSANIVIGLIGTYLTVRLGRETVAINWNALTRLIPKRWRTPLPDEEEGSAPDA